MFNGIVEAIGSIKNISRRGDCVDFSMTTTMDCQDLKVGDSLSVNGVCLTVTNRLDKNIFVTAVPETLRVTNLGGLIAGDLVNLEKSLAAYGRIGGHCVQGHVDAVAEILTLQADGNRALLAKISIPTNLSKYIVNKGYITIDGMSITVIQAAPEWFTATFIPHTQEVTIVNRYRPGTRVNIEVDILGKYVEKILGGYQHANVC